MSKHSKAIPGVHVTPRDRGGEGWATQTAGVRRAEGVYPTQRQAEYRGRDMLRQHGGGELVTRDRSGQIRSKDTIGQPDPNPPRDHGALIQDKDRRTSR